MIGRGKFPPSMNIVKDTLSAAAGRGDLAVVKALVDGLWIRHLQYNPEYHNWKYTAASAMSYDAAINNQLEITQYLVDLGVGPDDSNPLTAAATGGHLDMLHYLLTHGWDLNQSLTDCFKPAIKNDHKAALKLMLEHVDPDIFVFGNKKERRLLLFAAIACESEAYIGNLLRGGFPRGNLKMDLYIDEEFVWGGPRIYPWRDSIPFGPLELAVNTGNEKIVTLLLDWGADPNHLHSMSLPPAILAIKHERIFKLLLERGLNPNLQIRGYIRTTVMKEVIKFGKVTLAQELLNRDVPVEKTHLLYDAIRGGAPMLEFLLAKGILELPLGSKERELAVLHAIEKFQPSSFNFLINRGFPVPTEIHPRVLGNLAYIACEAKPISAMIDKMFDSILTHGVKIDTGLAVRDSSPLSNKIRWCQMGCVEYLLKKGADPLYPAYPGQESDNALFRAANWGYSYCSLGMLRLTLQAIDIHALPRKTLCQEIARCKAVSIEIEWWEGVRTVERFQFKLDNELGCLD